MDDFKHLTDEQVAAYLEGKGGISDIDFLNEMIQDPVLDAVVDIYNDLVDLEDMREMEDLDDTMGPKEDNDLEIR